MKKIKVEERDEEDEEEETESMRRGGRYEKKESL